MLPEFRKKLLPAELNWLVLNNLQKFDDKPAMIEDLYLKISKLKEHPILSMFIVYYEEIFLGFYNKHNSFPDMAWLDANFKKSNPLKILDDPFSMHIYEDLIKIIDRELLKQEINAKFVEHENPSLEDIRDLSSKLAKFSDNQTLMPASTKEDIINSYAEYKKNYKGVKTWIELLDAGIGNLGYQCVSVLGAPSSHGKSTLSLSVTYNSAVYGGLCIDYLSFEMNWGQMWFNLGSIESNILGYNVPASDIKEATLTEEQEEHLKICNLSILEKLNKSGGFINIIDQTSIQSNTFEALCSRLETIAEERGRKADLIIVDNVDNLAVLQSKDKDDTVKVNNCIRGLDAFSKKYYNGEGTTILLLTQLNRTGFKKLQANDESEESKTTIDYTCFQQYNALYEKATVALVAYSDAKMRSLGRMNIYPVKLRNKPVPLEPIKVPANFAYSRIGGDVQLQDTSIEDVEELINNDDVDELCEDMMDD